MTDFPKNVTLNQGDSVSIHLLLVDEKLGEYVEVLPNTGAQFTPTRYRQKDGKWEFRHPSGRSGEWRVIEVIDYA